MNIIVINIVSKLYTNVLGLVLVAFKIEKFNYEIMKKDKKRKIKGCACYGVNSIHPCFCSPFSNKDKPKPLKQAAVISKR
jgi:hypothetical protein